MLTSLIKRHLLIYLRDRWAIFFSFLSVLIILGLFILFLRNTFDLSAPDVDYMVYAWILSGVLMVSTVTVPLGFLGTMVVDLETKRLNDFYVSPIPRKTIVFSYLIAAIIIGTVFSMVNFIIGQLFLLLRVNQTIPLIDMIYVFFMVILSTALFSSLFFYAVSYLKTSNSHSTLSTLVGTLIGFLTGLYVPIGVLNTATRTVLSLLPTLHSVSAFRQIYMRDALETVFAGAPAETQVHQEFILGITLRIHETNLSLNVILLLVIAWTVLFSILSIVRIGKFKRVS